MVDPPPVTFDGAAPLGVRRLAVWGSAFSAVAGALAAAGADPVDLAAAPVADVRALFSIESGG